MFASVAEARKNELLKQRDKKVAELETLKGKTPSILWREDLDAFTEKLDQVEEKERKEEAGADMKGVKSRVATSEGRFARRQ